jgi:hypothetical protein
VQQPAAKMKIPIHSSYNHVSMNNFSHPLKVFTILRIPFCLSLARHLFSIPFFFDFDQNFSQKQSPPSTGWGESTVYR